MTRIDSPEYNDNRNYDYSNAFAEERDEYKLICEMVEPSSKVIDLGCGNGCQVVDATHFDVQAPCM